MLHAYCPLGGSRAAWCEGPHGACHMHTAPWGWRNERGLNEDITDVYMETVTGAWAMGLGCRRGRPLGVSHRRHASAGALGHWFGMEGCSRACKAVIVRHLPPIPDASMQPRAPAATHSNAVDHACLLQDNIDWQPGTWRRCIHLGSGYHCFDLTACKHEELCSPRNLTKQRSHLPDKHPDLMRLDSSIIPLTLIARSMFPLGNAWALTSLDMKTPLLHPVRPYLVPACCKTSRRPT